MCIPQEGISDRAVEQIVDTSVHQIRAQSVEVVKVIRHERLHQRTVEQIVCPKRVSERIEEQVEPEVAAQIVALSVPRIRKDIGGGDPAHPSRTSFRSQR